VRQQLKSGEIKAETWDKVPGWVTWVLYALTDQTNVDFSPVVIANMQQKHPELAWQVIGSVLFALAAKALLTIVTFGLKIPGPSPFL
jgi:hypothetical protein